MSVRRIRRGVYVVDVDFTFADGRTRRVRKTARFQDTRAAQKYEWQLRQSLLDGTYGMEEEDAPTLGDFVDRFMTESRNQNKLSSVAAKEQILRDHIIPAFGKMSLKAISYGEVEDFKASLLQKPSLKPHGVEDGGCLLGRKTANNVLAILRKLLRSAVERKLIENVPLIKPFKVAKPSWDFLDFDECERFERAADPEWLPALMCATKAGLRQGEIIGLQWTDLDLVRGKLHVRRNIWRGHIGTPKGGRERVVDMPDCLIQALQAHRHLKGPFVFFDANGKCITADTMKAPLRRALKRAGIARTEGQIGWHDLRHTYGSHLAMRGVPLKVIQELMGHATIEMTMRYAHLSPETKSSAVKVLDAPARLPDGNSQPGMGAM